VRRCPCRIRCSVQHRRGKVSSLPCYTCCQLYGLCPLMLPCRPGQSCCRLGKCSSCDDRQMPTCSASVSPFHSFSHSRMESAQSGMRLLPLLHLSGNPSTDPYSTRVLHTGLPASGAVPSARVAPQRQCQCRTRFGSNAACAFPLHPSHSAPCFSVPSPAKPS
jgi:hypothetical protein